VGDDIGVGALRQRAGQRSILGERHVLADVIEQVVDRCLAIRRPEGIADERLAFPAAEVAAVAARTMLVVQNAAAPCLDVGIDAVPHASSRASLARVNGGR
jgi:hypothetical protein